jgi:hypothetical protein
MKDLNNKLRTKQFLSIGEFNFLYQFGKENKGMAERVVQFINQFLIRKKL